MNAFSDALCEVFSCAAETYSAKGLRNLLADKAALHQCKRVCSRWVQCEDFLYTNVMLPVVAEIIHVFEPFVRLEAKVRESGLIGIIGEADATLVSDTILLSVNDKLVQMAICPTHYRLHGFVKCPDGRVLRNQDASPNCWLNVSQNYLKLKVSVLPSTRLTSR